MNVIQVFKDTGVFLHVLRIKGGARAWETPTGLAIDEDNLLYVVEMRANRVSVFALEP